MASGPDKPLIEPKFVHPALVGLNEEQHDAAMATDRPTLVLAPAGTGKTAVLAARYRYLLQEGMRPGEILALTFSNRAAGEMLDRVRADVADYDKRDLYIMTFHALGRAIIKSNPDLFGLTESFRPADEKECQDIMREAIRRAATDGSDDGTDKQQVQNLLRLVDEIKTAGLTPSSLLETRRFKGRTLSPSDLAIMEEYDVRLTCDNLVDFNDLILKPVLAFRTNPDFAQRWRRRFSAFIIDEFQDTNLVQYQLLRFLTEGKTNILMLGDDDQLIFQWRGASNSYVLDFEREWSGGQVLNLRANYRNAPRILEHARMLIGHNELRRQKDMVPIKKTRGIVEVRLFDEPNEEQDWIANVVAAQREKGTPLDQIAILTRTRSEASRVALTLASCDIPHYYPDNDLLTYREVRALIRWTRIILEERDRLSMLEAMRVPDCGLTSESINRLSDIAVAEDKPLIDVLRDVIRQGLAVKDGPLSAFLELFDRVRQIDLTLPAPFRRISEATGLDLFTDQSAPASRDALRAATTIFDELVEQLASIPAVLEAIALNAAGIGRSHGVEPKVQINTMHAAKGLEFSCIIAPRWEENHFPFDSRATVEIDEARRLAYVTMTRARDTFITTVCRRRPGASTILPSRFITEAGLDNPMF